MDAIIPVDTPEIDGTALDEQLHLRTDSITRAASTDENEVRSTDIIEPIVRTTHSITGGFDVQCVYQGFVAALKESQNPQSPIGTQDYINSYRELLK